MLTRQFQYLETNLLSVRILQAFQNKGGGQNGSSAARRSTVTLSNCLGSVSANSGAAEIGSGSGSGHDQDGDGNKRKHILISQDAAGKETNSAEEDFDNDDEEEDKDELQLLPSSQLWHSSLQSCTCKVSMASSVPVVLAAGNSSFLKMPLAKKPILLKRMLTMLKKKKTRMSFSCCQALNCGIHHCSLVIAKYQWPHLFQLFWQQEIPHFSRCRW